ncbi:MAG: peptidyl-tRNA hydrolase [Myxococcales bacterium]|nr:peptidyl-tRNA hydrolase [Myxococcales bacterium]
MRRQAGHRHAPRPARAARGKGDRPGLARGDGVPRRAHARAGRQPDAHPRRHAAQLALRALREDLRPRRVREAELVEVFTRARAAGLPAHLIRDAGRTEFGGVPTLTCCAIGPADAAAIDAITGNLTLY